jgi:hypothetical protein
MQVAEELNKIGSHKKKPFSLPIYATGMERQNPCAEKPSPDHRRNAAKIDGSSAPRTNRLDQIQPLVLDNGRNAHRLKEDIEAILRHAPRERRTRFFPPPCPSYAQPQPEFMQILKYPINPSAVTVINTEHSKM